MKRAWLCYMCCCLLHVVQAQENPVLEQQIENITEADEAETEDDTYLQNLQQLARNKLNLNIATEEMLLGFQFLSPLQIAHFLSYRKLTGLLSSIYELQSVPGWDQETIQRILPYVYVGDPARLPAKLIARFKGGEQTLLVRSGITAERAKGFLFSGDTSSLNFYPGSRERVLLRYKYQHSHLLQYGITAEKDPGEQWGKGVQKAGFDFYSAHFFLREVHPFVKAIALGDYSVNLGQGLIQWQAMAFRKSAAVLNIKRQAAVLRPFNTANEFQFNRGAAITLGKKQWELSLFASVRKLTANLDFDSSVSQHPFITSLNSSGLHRTFSEQADKNAVQLSSFGGNIKYHWKQLQFGLNGVQYVLNRPLIRSDQAYHIFSFSGTRMMNMSVDFSYTWRNLHWFGEMAVHNQKALAGLSGLLLSVDSKIDFSIVYRNLDKRYQSLFGNAFTEATMPGNERGIFIGAVIRPTSPFKFEAYADLYRFPWLRYRIDAPSVGYDYLVQLNYQPNKQVQLYTRFRIESRAVNYNDNGRLATEAVNGVVRRNWRTQMQMNINAAIVLRQRMELMWFDKGGPKESNGFLSFLDFIYKPQLKPYGCSMRLQYFETDGYDSRIYAFENDVLYSYTVPAFFDHGSRWYLNVQYDITRNITCWLRCAQSLYRNRNTVGSGLDEIAGNRRTDLRFQLLWRF